MKPINLAIADDHKIFRNGLKATLEDCPDFKLIIEASNGKELIGLLADRKPDVILMDIKMPEMDGMQTTAYVHQHFKDVKVLALSMHNEDKYIVDMMKAGASGYLLKNAEPEEIIDAILTVYSKGFYFNEHLSVTLIKQLVGPGSHNEGGRPCRRFHQRARLHRARSAGGGRCRTWGCTYLCRCPIAEGERAHRCHCDLSPRS